MYSPAFIKGKRIGEEVSRMSLAGYSWESIKEFMVKERAADLISSAKAMFDRLSAQKEAV